MAEPLTTNGYDHVVVIDTQVVLETKPLEQLPWSDLFPGSVLLLVCRQVQSEIDAKKNDGRLGKRAREFNKSLDGFIETRTPSSVLNSPRVDVALLANRRIDWNAFDDLDSADGDDRIVAQALNANVDEPSRLVVLSHDMRPRDAALTHGLSAVKLPEAWLRKPEPSPEQRRIGELEGKIRLLSADQPEIGLKIHALSAEPWQYRIVAAPTQKQIRDIINALETNAPRTSKPSLYNSGSHDWSHARRLEAWISNIGRDIPLINTGIARQFAQQRIRVSIENVGSISAEGLSVEIRSGNAVLHSKPYVVLITGPAAPRERALHEMIHIPRSGFMPHPREPFNFYWDERGPGNEVSLSCASFRQGKTYDLDVTVELLGKTTPKAQIEVVVTASNMKGRARSQFLVAVEQVQTPFNDIFDAERRKLRLDLSNDADFGDFTIYRNDGSEHED